MTDQKKEKCMEVAEAITKKYGLACNCGAVKEVPGGYLVRDHTSLCVLNIQTDFTAELLKREQREEKLSSLLRSIITTLPSNRDWLDPNIEREAQALLKELGYE